MPLGALLQINTNCNLFCSHCSQSAPYGSQESGRHNLSTEHWIGIFGCLQSAGVTRVRFTGGEVFLRRDIEYLCCVAADLGMEVSFITNGIPIASKQCEWLRKVLPTTVWISMYGFPASVYEYVTGRRGSFKCVTDVVSMLLGAGIDVGFYYPLGDCTDYGIASFIHYAHQLGIRKVRILQVLPHGRATEQGGMEPLPQNRLGPALDHIADIGREYPALEVKVSMDSGQTNLFRSKGLIVPHTRGCEAGLHKLWTIDSRGCALPCCLFLGKNRGELFNAGVMRDFERWRWWNRQRTLQTLGVQGEQPVFCPALPHGRERANREDFVCPLTYAEPPR